MNNCNLIFTTSLCFLLLACTTNKEAQAPGEDQDEMVEFFTDNGFGNAVAVVQHPAGVHHEGVTYVAYQGPLEDPYVVSYDHEKQEWKGPFKAGVSEMGKDPDRKKAIDNHGKPSILIDDEGYIHVAFGGHGGMRKHGKNPLGNHHYGRNAHAVSKEPLDISSWETLDNIPPFGTYNQLIKMDNGDIYLFYRHGAHRSDWVYQKSTDNGRTFADPVSFLKHKRRTDDAAEDSWYPWITKGSGNELIVAFDYHLCSDGGKGKGHNGQGHIPYRYNVYYMVFNTESGQWHNVKGEPLTVPVTREEADEKALVAETPGNWTFQGVVELTDEGYPHLGMTIGEDIGEKSSAPKAMHHFRWDGTQWLQKGSGGLPTGGGDVALATGDNLSVYLQYKNEENVAEVGRWASTDAGSTFRKANVLLMSNANGFAISSLINEAHPEARLVVAEKERGTAYRRMYLLGDDGPIKRKRQEAEVLVK